MCPIRAIHVSGAKMGPMLSSPRIKGCQQHHLLNTNCARGESAAIRKVRSAAHK